MARVCESYGIVVYIYYDDHPDAHFHAVYGVDEVAIKMADMSVMAGRLPPRAMGLVFEWASARQGAPGRARARLPMIGDSQPSTCHSGRLPR